jgi:hypothetical protein
MKPPCRRHRSAPAPSRQALRVSAAAPHALGPMSDLRRAPSRYLHPFSFLYFSFGRILLESTNQFQFDLPVTNFEKLDVRHNGMPVSVLHCNNNFSVLSECVLQFLSLSNVSVQSISSPWPVHQWFFFIWPCFYCLQLIINLYGIGVMVVSSLHLPLKSDVVVSLLKLNSMTFLKIFMPCYWILLMQFSMQCPNIFIGCEEIFSNLGRDWLPYVDSQARTREPGSNQPG